MFGAVYFAQIVFAGMPGVVEIPPPPIPPLVLCEEYAIGLCVGTANRCDEGLTAYGIASRCDGLNPVGSAGGCERSVPLGIPGGPVRRC